MPYQLDITTEVVDGEKIRKSAVLTLDGMPVFLMLNFSSKDFTISPFVNTDVRFCIDRFGIDLNKRAKPSSNSSLLIEVCKDGGLCFHKEQGFVFIHRNGAVQCSFNDDSDAVFINKITRNGDEVSPALYYATKEEKRKKIETAKEEE